MRNHPNIDVVTSVIRDRITVDLYVIHGEPPVLVDTGIGPTPERDLQPVLKGRGLDLPDIGMILNTHGHPDHMGGNALVQSRSKATVRIHEEDAVYLEDPARGFSVYMEPISRALGGDVEMERRMFTGMAGGSAAPDVLLKDGDLVECGGGIDLKVVHLPGHTLGSVGFFWEREGLLFSGDAIPGLHSEQGKLPIIVDLEAYQASLKRVRDMDIRCLLCSHPYRGLDLPPATIREGADVGTYLSESLELAERLHDAIMSHVPYREEIPFPELADRILRRLPEKYGITPLSEVSMPLITPQSLYFTLFGVPSVER